MSDPVVDYLRKRDQRRRNWLIGLFLAACLGAGVGYASWRNAQEDKAREERVDRMVDAMMCDAGQLSYCND